MPAAAGHALSVLQGLSVDEAALADVRRMAMAKPEHRVFRSSRSETRASRSSHRSFSRKRFDPRPVAPLVEQLYLRACLTLEGACACDAKAAPAVALAMDRLNALQLSAGG